MTEEEKKKSLDLQDKITEKGITRLIHFTSRKNLESILKNGIITIIGTRIILKIVSLFAKFMSILLYYLCSLSIICIH